MIGAPIELVYFIHTTDRLGAETLVHSTLRGFRITPRREYFAVDTLMAAFIMSEIGHVVPRTPVAGMRRSLYHIRVSFVPSAPTYVPTLFRPCLSHIGCGVIAALPPFHSACSALLSALGDR